MTTMDFNKRYQNQREDPQRMNSNPVKGEQLHSGHFMVSSLEEAEVEDDFEEEMQQMQEPTTQPPAYQPSPHNPPTVHNLQLERYIPNPQLDLTQVIDSDLSTVFNTLNVTYKQKLTSPKWNPFKGIRLRWKEKIRLNNVIWRCWHMQFIMKKRTLVCQFASPLDVDIHNTPQAIILEGKYWKRKWKVITAEYKKWRRFNVNKGFGNSNLLETKSEIDTLEWANDNLLMLSDNMSSDTLFSTISQFPFPDSREIARGAGRADFIQPSLGPLQPNFDDFMDLDLDLFNSFTTNSRLAPVPEEQTEDLLKAIDFPAMTSMDPMQAMMHAGNAQSVGNSANLMNVDQPLMCSATIYSQDMSMAPSGVNIMHRSNVMSSDMDPFMSNQLTMQQQQQLIAGTTQDMKDGYKGKFCRGYLKQHQKREPHNYDKCQPTAHQTTIYTQMMSQPESPAPPNPYNNIYSSNISEVAATPPLHMSPIQTTTNNYNMPNSVQSVLNLSSSQLQIQNMASNMIMNLQQPSQIQQQQAQQFQMQQPQNSSHDVYKSPQSPGFKSYHGQQPYKIPSQAQGFTASRIMRQQSPPHAKPYQTQPPQVVPTKEMYRSNSLPINATIQLPTKDDNFVVPKYQTKGNRAQRTRSNSMIVRQGQLLPTLQSAASEPLLNASSALLAQLLTSNNSAIANINSMTHNHPQRASSSHQLFTIPSTSTSSLVEQPIQQTPKQAPLTSSMSISSSSSQGSNSSFIYSANTPTLSPDSAFDQELPLSPDRSKYPQKETQRRAGHIHAEQKRRYNIKNGFEALSTLIPQLRQNPNAKLSKASMLQKGADYIKQLRVERSSVNDQMETLRKEIETLNNSLNHLHTALPANGAPVSRQRTGRVKDLYDQYVLQRTQKNWKFWIFGLIFEPMFNSYNSTVSVASLEELCRTTMLYVDNSCSLVEIRPAVSNKLRYLSTTTDVLSENPTSLQEEVQKAVAAKAREAEREAKASKPSK